MREWREYDARTAEQSQEGMIPRHTSSEDLAPCEMECENESVLRMSPTPPLYEGEVSDDELR